MKKNERPVNLGFKVVINQPLTAIASILHRIAGIVLFFAVFLLLWALDLALSSPEGFSTIAELLKTNIFVKFITWAILTALAYHWLAGIKHLIMDFDILVSTKGVWILSISVLISGILLSILAGVWLW